jgi:hypothetical protein
MKDSEAAVPSTCSRSQFPSLYNGHTEPESLAIRMEYSPCLSRGILRRLPSWCSALPLGPHLASGVPSMSRTGVTGRLYTATHRHTQPFRIQTGLAGSGGATLASGPGTITTQMRLH